MACVAVICHMVYTVTVDCWGHRLQCAPWRIFVAGPVGLVGAGVAGFVGFGEAGFVGTGVGEPSEDADLLHCLRDVTSTAW